MVRPVRRTDTVIYTPIDRPVNPKTTSQECPENGDTRGPDHRLWRVQVVRQARHLDGGQLGFAGGMLGSLRPTCTSDSGRARTSDTSAKRHLPATDRGQERSQ